MAGIPTLQMAESKLYLGQGSIHKNKDEIKNMTGQSSVLLLLQFLNSRGVLAVEYLQEFLLKV